MVFDRLVRPAGSSFPGWASRVCRMLGVPSHKLGRSSLGSVDSAMLLDGYHPLSHGTVCRAGPLRLSQCRSICLVGYLLGSEQIQSRLSAGAAIPSRIEVLKGKHGEQELLPVRLKLLPIPVESVVFLAAGGPLMASRIA